MNMIKASQSIYDALKQLHADYDAVGALMGMSETKEYIALGKTIEALHIELNEARKVFGMKWEQFLIAIERAPKEGEIAVKSGGTNKDDPGH